MVKYNGIFDPSDLSSTTKGDIVEDRIKEQILLYGQGLLSVYKPVTDSEGVDLIVVKSGCFHPVFIQVKGRFKLQEDGAFLCDVRMKTFKHHPSYFIVGAYFNPINSELHDKLLFIPTEIIEKEGQKVITKTGPRSRVISRLSSETHGKWARYIIDKKELANKILDEIAEIEKRLR